LYWFGSSAVETKEYSTLNKSSCRLLAATRHRLGATPLLLHELHDALECLESLRHAAHGAMAAAEGSCNGGQACAEEAHSLRKEQLRRPLAAARDDLKGRCRGDVALRRGAEEARVGAGGSEKAAVHRPEQWTHDEGREERGVPLLAHSRRSSDRGRGLRATCSEGLCSGGGGLVLRLR